MLTIIASVISFLISRHIERSREIEREIREKKIPYYDQIIRLFFESVFCPEALKREISPEELTRQMHTFSVHSLIWASDDVYVKWTDLLRSMQGTIDKPFPSKTFIEEKMIPLGNFLLSIRKDIGHSNKNISSIDIWHPFVNDLDQVLKSMAEKSQNS